MSARSVLLSIFILSCCLQRVAIAQFTQVADVGIEVHSIYFQQGCNAKVGFIGSEIWYVYRTSDGGNSWQQVMYHDGNQYYVSCFTFKDSLTGWFSVNEHFASHHDQPGIYKTTDGGVTWNPLSLIGDFPSVYYNASNGRLIATSWGGSAYTTTDPNYTSTDDGATWQPFEHVPYCGITFRDGKNGIISSANSEPYLLTRDGGQTWAHSNFNVESYTPFHLPCSQSYITISERDGKTYRSDDDGLNWHLISSQDLSTPIGYIVGDSRQIFTQSATGVWKSVDEGVSWTLIGGPHHDLDAQMVAKNGYLWVGNQNGRLFRARYDSTIEQLSIGPDTIRFGNDECRSVSLATVSMPCPECLDSFRLTSINILGSSNYSILSVPSVGSGIGNNDSIVLSRFSLNSDADTAVLHLRFRQRGVEFDTIVVLYGLGSLRKSFQLDTDTLQFRTATCGDIVHTVHLSSVLPGACGDSLRITSLALQGSYNWSIQNTPALPYTLHSLDSLVFVRAADTVVFDTAKISMTLSQHGVSFDTVITLLGQGVVRRAAQLGLRPDNGQLNQQLLTGSTTGTTVYWKSAVASSSGLNTIDFSLPFPSRFLSKLTLTPQNSWSVAKESDQAKSIDIKMTHAAYDIADGEAVLQVAYHAALGDTTLGLLSLTNVRFNESDPDFEKCALSSISPNDSILVTEIPGPNACGDSILATYLRGEPLIGFLRIAPNPACIGEERMDVQFRASAEAIVNVRVYDLIGKTVISESIPSRAGENSRSLRIGSLAEGTYIVELESGGVRLSSKVSIRKN